MSTIIPTPELDTFFARLREAHDSLLALDYDGTLAPFNVDPAHALPYPGVLERIDGILERGTTRVAIVSGRWTRDLLPLLDMRGRVELWGSHGWERLLPDEQYHLMRAPETALQALAEADARAEALERWGARLERKPSTVAVHWRGLSPELVGQIRGQLERDWSELAVRAPVQMLEFDGGLELRAAGRTKGDVVRTLLEEVGTAATAAYLGDDITDEDAFYAMKGNGLSVLVRSAPRASQADVVIRPPQELTGFLQRWMDSMQARR